MFSLFSLGNVENDSAIAGQSGSGMPRNQQLYNTWPAEWKENERSVASCLTEIL